MPSSPYVTIDVDGDSEVLFGDEAYHDAGCINVLSLRGRVSVHEPPFPTASALSERHRLDGGRANCDKQRGLSQGPAE
jgi:hypothetical protein